MIKVPQAKHSESAE